jgi:hypothetical protein
VTGTAALRNAVRFVSRPRVSRWVFGHYLGIAPPTFAAAAQAVRPAAPAPALSS